MSGNTILVMEDEEELRMAAEMFLRHAGYDVEVARNGLEGLELYRSNVASICLVFSDLNMPEIDGFTAYVGMKKINPTLRAVFASGSFGEEARANLRNAGVQRLIQKPYARDEVLQAIGETLEERRIDQMK